MTVFGKRSPGLGKSGSAVLDAPEDSYGHESEPIREPAPAGALQRARLVDEPDSGAYARTEEDVYKPRRESASYRLRMGLPKSVFGKVLTGTLAALVLGAGVGALLAVRSRLLHDERFAIATSSEIQISGNQHLTRAQILSVFGSDLERNIFKVPLGERRADLERLPWVAHATVMRLLPNHLRIAVTERTPVAFVRQGTQIGLVDANGVLLDMPQDAAGDPHYSFPVLTGLAESDPLSTRAARMDVYRKFMQDLDSEVGNGVKPTQSLSEVDVSNPEDVKALIASGSSDILVHFGDEDFLPRYKLFEENLPQWKTQYPKLASVDTRYEHQFVLEMQPGTTTPLAGDAASDAAATPAETAAVKTPAAKASTKTVKPAAPKTVAAKLAAAKPDANKQKIAAQLAAARKAAPLAKPAAAAKAQPTKPAIAVKPSTSAKQAVTQ